MREARGINQVDLADAVDSSQAMISAIENGNRYPHIKLAKKIGEFFGLSVEEIWDLFYAD